MSGTPILELATVVRSKNSGPFELTLDIIFNDVKTFAAVRRRGLLTAERVAALYGAPPSDIVKIVWFEPAAAVKVTLRRFLPCGAAGETDIYGAQQHAPLLELRL